METRLKEVLAVVNNKGGVGKTTTVQSLAAAIVRRHQGERVLVVDLDAQRHLSILHGFKQQQGERTIYDAIVERRGVPVYPTKRKNVYLAPSATEMEAADVAIASKPGNPHRVLARCFETPLDDHTGEGLTNVIEAFDYVIIDCPPALSQITYNAMVMATGVLVPVQLENLAVDGMKNLLLAMSETRRDDNRNLELRGIVLTMVNQQLNVTRGLTERLRESLGSQVCRTVIRRNVKLVEAQGNYQDIYDYRQWCPAAIDYGALAKELFD